MTSRPHILIAGAGIGGLTAALSFLRAGYDVDVYEQAPELGEVGAGVQISANGTRVLFALGLERALRDIAWIPEGKEIRVWDSGETWPLFDLGVESERLYGFPYYMFHRADLHNVLAEAVAAMKPNAVHLDCKVETVEKDGQGVTLRFADGRTAKGDMLVGADGVHSAVRRALFGADEPRFTGCMAWRGVIPAEKLPKDMLRPVGTNWVGPGGHVVHYFLRRGELVNFVGIRERDDWRVESWSTEGTVGECLADFDGWHEDVRTLIRHIERPYKWALMTRDPIARWSDGAAGLIGDACHSMLPFMAQGAVMAIEDGYILPDCLASQGDNPAAAWTLFERLRHDRTSRAVRASAANTSIFHSPLLGDRESAAAFVAENWEPARIKERYDWLFTYDATRAVSDEKKSCESAA